MKILAVHISVPVTDVEAAVRFYECLLNLTVFSRDGLLCQLGFDRHRISIRQTGADSPSLQRDAAAGMRARHFGFRLESRGDVDLCFARVLSCGGRTVSSPSEREDGYTFFCCDPSGNQVEIYYSTEPY
jgi:catechol-2,3-dioxygenase